VRHAIFSFVFLIAGSLLFQSFQCASPEMTSGKMAMNQRDYDKAEVNFKKELAKNPTNAEVLLYMARISFMKQNYADAITFLQGADQHAKDPKIRNMVEADKANAWVNAYNQGLKYYLDFASNNNKAMLDTALLLFDAGVKLKPDMLGFYDLKGKVLEAKGDTVAAIENYKALHNKIKPQIDFAKSNGIHLDMSRDDLHRKFGDPKKSKVDSVSYSDKTVITDFFTTSDLKELYVYLSPDKSGSQRVQGWNFNPPANMRDTEKMNYSVMQTDPITFITQYYYENKRFDDALVYVNDLITLMPTNAMLAQYKVQIYESAGKTDEAMAELKQLTKEQPDNKAAWSQYGDMLTNTGKYDEAIDAYQSALKIDPNFDFVLRNIASAFKNKAALIQKEESDKFDKDDKYKVKTERYFPILKQSAEYFERAQKTKRFGNDFVVLTELANIYHVTEDTPSLDETIKKLEKIEYSIDQDLREDYFLAMLKIFSQKGDVAKTKQIEEKLNKLK